MDLQVHSPMILPHFREKTGVGSWAPTAARQMKAIVEGFKNIECVEPVVTIKSTLNEASEKQMDELVAALTK